jgi:hypothetical protein
MSLDISLDNRWLDLLSVIDLLKEIEVAFGLWSQNEQCIYKSWKLSRGKG